MKTYINLGIAFTDERGTRRLSFQLMDKNTGRSVMDADYVEGICTRALGSLSVKPTQRNEFLNKCGKMAAAGAVKSLEWAYPSSTTADDNGHAKGCWTVQLGLPGLPLESVRTFSPNEKDRALDCARQLPFPWSAITLAAHPEFASVKLESAQ